MSSKISFFIALFACFYANAQDLEQIRKSYPAAVESSEITTKLNNELANITNNDNSVLVAYKGAVLTLMAKFAKSKKDKKQYFKEGISLIETGINTDSKNIEMRYIRLSVQENSPKFLGYKKNMEADKQYIIENYPYVSVRALKAVLKTFIETSGSFSVAEKQAVKL